MIHTLRGFCVLAEGQNVSPFASFTPLIVIFVLFYFLLIRPQTKERRRRNELLQSLKKNDRVLTVGGIIGTIADLSSDGNRVTLKVDDNTRIKMQRSSIQSLYDEAEADKTTGGPGLAKG